MAKLYAITCGEYSDYHIVALCSDIKAAKEIRNRFQKRARFEEYRIESYEDAKYTLHQNNIRYVHFDEHLNVSENHYIGYSPDARVGEVEEYKRTRRVDTGKTRKETVHVLSWIDFKTHAVERDVPIMKDEEYFEYEVTVNCKDEQKAVKIARDKLAQFLANKNGI